MNWYLEALKKYAEFSGRSRRKEYWNFALFNIILSVVLTIMDIKIGLFNEARGLGLLSSLYALIVLLPGIAVSIRRLHDTNRNGWWLLLSLIPIIGHLTLIVFFAQKGTSGSNEYGTDPLESRWSIP